ncbi:MAG TPA: hypothetical protein DIS90_02160, partial [Cytophagales bacterium]|nr:hypothetical protein [Cytophagales bacterium]
MKVNLSAKPLGKNKLPKKILVMRFQALGDTIITLPYLQSLKTNYPGIILHLLTRYEVAQIPLALSIFEKVITIGGGRNAKFQFLISILLLPKLWFNQYDAVL